MLRSLLGQEPCGRTERELLTGLPNENSGTMCDGKDVFTVTEDEKLVKIVRGYPCVYDITDAQYKDQSMKDNAWKEIAEIVERPVDDCKKRWKNIKDTYKKRQRKGIVNSVNKKKKWPLADSLTFLDLGESTSGIQSEEASPSTSSTNDTQSQNVKDTSISFWQTSRTSKETSRFLPISSTNSTQSSNVEDIPISSWQTSRGSRETSQLPSASSTKDTQSSNVEDIPISSWQTSQGNRETPQFHRITSNNVQSQGPEDIRTFRRPSKRSRLNENCLESLDSWGIERETILKLIAEEKRDDDVDLFFRSIASSVKKLRPDLINEAKMKSLQIVIDLENRNSLGFNLPRESSRSPSTFSLLTPSPSSVDITIKSELDDT